MRSVDLKLHTTRITGNINGQAASGAGYSWAARNLNVKDGNRVSTTRKLKSIRYKWRSRRFERFNRHYHFPSPPRYFLFARFRAFAWAVLRAWNAAIVSGEKEIRQVLLRAEAPRLWSAIWSPHRQWRITFYGGHRLWVLCVIQRSLFSTLTGEICNPWHL